jgi:NADH:ubiquinone oxidoreductase subunit H
MHQLLRRLERQRLVEASVPRDIAEREGLGATQGIRMANTLFYYGVPLAVGAVAIVLVLGLANMMRGGSPNTSQRLMRWRVLLQFVAIVVIMITVWAMGR